MNEEQQPPIWLEVTAAALVPAACFGFSRVFIHTSTVLPVLGAALLSSAVAVLARRLRVPLPIATLVSLALLGALIVNRYAPGTARLGVIPTGTTIETLRALFNELIDNFRELKSPVPGLAPFVATAMIGAWIMAFLTDWGAMRLRLAFEPVLPSGLLFIFSSIPPVNSGTNQVISTVVFASAVAAWAVSQRAANLLQRGVWLSNDHRRGPASIGAVGAVVAAIAVIGGAIIGGRLPGAGADPVYSFNEQADDTRVVVSPFVNIQSRLVRQTSRELFTVTTDQPTYWRIAGLDTYEENIWKVAGDFSPEDGRLPGEKFEGGVRSDIVQDYEIKALAAIWLPAAFAPAEILEASNEVTWNSDNSSLTISRELETSDGVSYSVLSSTPAYAPDQLRAAPDTTPADIAERYLDLPADLSPRVAIGAREITAGQTTRYDRMRALQDHFRTYGYNVNLSPRVGDPIEQFLNEREGFCQQFAGTFALMARSLGIPARVATGFTWGDPIGTDPETGRTIYSVTGRHTHAWPEVFFEGMGWVAFEPTPGRGLPGAVSYTGVAAEQDSEVQPTNPGEPTTTSVPDLTDPAVTAQPEFPEEFDPGTLNEPILEDDNRFFLLRWLGALSWPWVALFMLVLAYVGGVPFLWQLRRNRRRSQAKTASQRAETSWSEAVETLELGYEVKRKPAETRSEFAGRLSTDRRVPSQELGDLAEIATVARFHPSGVTDMAAERADELAKHIETSVNTRVPIYVRLRRLLDPRRVFQPSARITTEQRVAPPPKTGDDRELVDSST